MPKTKQQQPTKELFVDAEQLAYDKDEYVNDLGRFLNEHLGFEVVRTGNKLKVLADPDFSKRALKTRIKKFLYITDLKLRYRPIAVNGEPDAYQIHRRKYAVY